MHCSRLPFAAACALLLSASAPRAQGSNSCSSATVIAGTGTFGVNTAGATDSLEQPGGCPSIHADVWFAWTATATQNMNLATCGGTAADTVVAVYATSSCPASGTQIACNDDGCGQQSSLFFSATSGTTYLIQIGAWSAGTTFNGLFSLQPGSDPCGTPSNGPDVLIGDITSIQNANPTGALDSFTLGTTACNVGNAVLSWSGPTSLHPVISETFYKYKVVDGSGRFEQIGMSWLKHGFASDTGSLCCTCQNPGNNQIMGVGCSDPYSASQSGSQSTLTPRWQVNAHTGVFPYPGANPSWSGNTARRCEVALADLEPNSAAVRYYAECTYVTADDAAAGNNNNNASYKQMAVTGGPTNYTFATSGTTQRGVPAIRAWPLLEPGVTLTSVQVPGDGLFLVGSHATSLGGGLYHYEYAVHNMNADRAGGSFSVPIPSGALVTNIGFHDVTYRNGDGQGNVSQTSTDWAGAVVGGAVTWASETQAQNPNANAIRWATTYNFRFDSDAAPVSGVVTVGLWKPGTPTSFAAAAEVPAGGATTFAYCFGDGSGTACPCGNTGAPGAGCANSLGTGAVLAASGVASISADTFVIAGSGMPDGSVLYFQGTTQQNGGAGAVFGDGLRCAGGTVTRLGTTTNVLGASQYPAGGDPSISTRGANTAGDVRTYQGWYRNAASFCQPETFNLTGGLQTTWQP
ncbi:MAG: hypothetical protein NTY35_08915 [Planctomycetota bacterium]|nr:hypothetical protein [Planctomycetota bacterium]